eukprot:796279-Amphidinium_carterae.1
MQCPTTQSRLCPERPDCRDEQTPRLHCPAAAPRLTCPPLLTTAHSLDKLRFTDDQNRQAPTHLTLEQTWLH